MDEAIESIEQELADLKERCLKKDGTPRKDASDEDLARMQELCDALEPADVVEPLDEDEKAEMAELERRSRTGTRNTQPSPHEMMRLGALRERAKV